MLFGDQPGPGLLPGVIDAALLESFTLPILGASKIV